MNELVEALKELLPEYTHKLGPADALAKAREALRAYEAQQAESEPATADDNSQQWAGMDGATAWHLIERHADNWSDIGKMMSEWLAANASQPAAIPEGMVLVPEEPTPEMLTAGFAAWNGNEGRMIGVMYRAMIAAKP